MTRKRVVVQHNARDYVPWLHAMWSWDGPYPTEPDAIWLCAHFGNRGCDPLFGIDVRVPRWRWLERLLGSRLI